MKTENLFVSVNDGKEMSRDLPWFSDNPNQGRDANHVAIRSKKRPGKLVDGSEARPCCTQCTVPRVRNGDSHCWEKFTCFMFGAQCNVVTKINIALMRQIFLFSQNCLEHKVQLVGNLRRFILWYNIEHLNVNVIND